MPPVILGADLGGTHFRVGLREVGSNALLDEESIPAAPGWDAAGVAAAAASLLEALRTRHKPVDWPISAVGCGLTGDIDYRTGTCHSMKRFPKLEGANLVEALEQELCARAAILNDGLCAALAELRLGAGQGVRSFAMVTLGTGIGGGVVLDGELLTGPTGRIGKVGHMILDLDGPVRCHCGLPGCWQTLAGKQGVVARAHETAGRRPGSALAALCDRADELDLAAVISLANLGDPAAEEVVRETGRYVGIGLANLVKLFAPELLLLGGGIAENNPLLLKAAQEAVHAYAVKPYQWVEVQPAKLGWRAGVLGATVWAETRAIGA